MLPNACRSFSKDYINWSESVVHNSVCKSYALRECIIPYWAKFIIVFTVNGQKGFFVTSVLRVCSLFVGAKCWSSIRYFTSADP